MFIILFKATLISFFCWILEILWLVLDTQCVCFGWNMHSGKMRKGLWKSIVSYSLVFSQITNSQNLDRLTYKSDTTVLETAEKR